MPRTFENWERGIKIGLVTISNLRYADDTTLFTSSEVEMALAINKSKTKLMVIDRFASVERTNLLQEYETVDQFQYRGSVITGGGSCETEISRRIGLAKTAMMEHQNR
ncbi:unnamed protein product [Arctia plantaginis]|uniref:Reverse transcriptase domain-containing protein n=1 Tax=Arctia plantaginis TaxID=874455 RepID=A0A8S1AVS7_ARCPL|nr:unnamed protein product [Arctia plantaginis]